MPVLSSFTPTLLKRLAEARSVAVLTGAGISAESGVPTFRDPDGLWERFRPEELANIRAFLANPVLVQGWYAHRAEVVASTQPNPGHEALVALEAMVDDFTLITQNVDNLHQRAGSRNVIELHGNLTRSYCIDCGQAASEGTSAALAAGEAVTCLACTGLIRPDVVWFGEMLPGGAMEAAVGAAQQADVFLSIGTSAIVYPAASIPAYTRHAYLVEVNIQRSAIAGDMDEVLLGPSGEVLPQLIDALQTVRS